MTGRSFNTDAQTAVAAWRALGAGRAGTGRVEIAAGLNGGRPVYRLVGAGPDGSNVIAKCCSADVARTERTVYERVLPRLSLTVPRYYGSVEDGGELSWLFLEDVGGERFDHTVPEQRALAARWLGRLHVGAPDAAAGIDLPDRGPLHYLAHLRSARRAILENLSNPAFRDTDVATLESTVALLGEVEGVWAAVERFCAKVPSTLVHGDFRRKNVYVRRNGGGLRLDPIDWETAGWGVPAADLAPARRSGFTSLVDAGTYAAIVQERWRELDAGLIARLSGLGKMFRRLAAIDWSCQSLAFPWPEKPVSCVEIYRDELGQALEAEPWSG